MTQTHGWPDVQGLQNGTTDAAPSGGLRVPRNPVLDDGVTRASIEHHETLMLLTGCKASGLVLICIRVSTHYPESGANPVLWRSHCTLTIICRRNGSPMRNTVLLVSFMTSLSACNPTERRLRQLEATATRTDAKRQPVIPGALKLHSVRDRGNLLQTRASQTQPRVSRRTATAIEIAKRSNSGCTFPANSTGRRRSLLGGRIESSRTILAAT